MTMCAIYFIRDTQGYGSLMALALSMGFLPTGVILQQEYEDEAWQRRIRGIRE